MKRPLLLLPVLALLAGLVSLANGNSTSVFGPVPSRTGALATGGRPAELNCWIAGCHMDVNPLNSTANGSLQILDLPDWYSPGTTYRMRVRLANTATASSPDRRWGFQITAIHSTNGTGAGTFTVRDHGTPGPADDSLWVQAGTGTFSTRRYVEHNFVATHYQHASPVEWSFDWTAPAAGEGTILFYAAGNAADGSTDPTGDWIYTTADSMRDTTTAAVSRSWGAVKQRWR